MAESKALKIFAGNVVQRRMQLNLSQKELAAKLNISCEAMNRIENAKMAPKMSRLDDIAEALQTTVASLFTSIAAESNTANHISAILEELPQEGQEVIIENIQFIKRALILDVSKPKNK